MRLFVGIPATAELRADAARWREQHAARLPVRWLDAANLHVTLLPPWEAPDAEFAVATLTTAVLGAPLSLLFTRVEFAPARAPRLIWAQAETPTALIALRDAAAAAFGRPIEGRPLRAHLTLARFQPQAFARFPSRDLKAIVRWPLDVDEVVLFASHLGRNGARYEPLARATLR